MSSKIAVAIPSTYLDHPETVALSVPESTERASAHSRALPDTVRYSLPVLQMRKVP